MKPVVFAAVVLLVSPAWSAPGTVTIDSPLDGTIFPPDLAPPTLLWHDESEAATWIVSFATEGAPTVEAEANATAPPRGFVDERCIAATNRLYEPTPYQASAKAWKPSREVWARVVERARGRQATITVEGRAGAGAVSRGKVSFTVSVDPVGAPLFYRDVPLMPSMGKDGVVKPLDKTAQPLIAWRLKDVGRDDSKVLLENMPTCANCHSFSSEGRTLAMDVDGPDGDKGAYAIAAIRKETVIGNEQMMTWNAFAGKPKGRMTLGFLSRISPDGRYVVSTVNEMLYVRNFTDWKILQVFYPTRGILAWYDTTTKRINALPGADAPAFVHCDPVWTPDGKELIFARAAARDPYLRDRPVAMQPGDPNETPIVYDLYRMPFAQGRGGTPRPIPGASGTGMSHSFPKVSPDGQWLVWVQSRNGQLLRPDGKLWIAPLDGSRPPRMMRCNTSLMNSWHSFNPTGRWMVFSSKVNTPYTQLFLTHIDENGDDSPPVLVENTQASNRAANIPEFVDVAYEAFDRITVPAVEHREHYYKANDLAQAGKKDEAIGELERALEGPKKDWRTYDWKYHDKISRLLLEQGRVDEALAHIQESLRQNPANAPMHANLASILFERGDLDEARKHLDAALRLAPGDARSWVNRAAVRLSQGDAPGAEEDYARAIALEPRNPAPYAGRGMAHWALNDAAHAREDFDAAIRYGTKDPTPYYFRALLRHRAGDDAGARVDLDAAASRAKAGTAARRSIDALRAELDARN